MMKYLAILKDSWRETVDGKVFLAMVVLSAIAMLITSSFAFIPEPAVSGVEAMAKQFPGGFVLREKDRVVGYRVEDFMQLNDVRRPWNGEYKFQVIAEDAKPLGFRTFVWLFSFLDQKALAKQSFEEVQEVNLIFLEASKKPEEEQEKFLQEKLGPKIAKVDEAQMVEFIRRGFKDGGNLDIQDVKMLPPKADDKRITRFEVHAKGKSNTFNVWPHRLELLFGAHDTGFKLPIGPLVLIIEKYVVGYAGAAVFLLISSVMTAFFIPNMLRKGTVDLLVSKPIHRWTLLLYKYIGGLLFMLLSSTVLIGGFWLVMGLRTGLWGVNFLLMIPIMTFQFAIYYAASTLAATFTRNTIVAILAAGFTWATLFVTNIVYDESRPSPGNQPSQFHKYVKGVHAVLPRVGDFDRLATNAIQADLLDQDAEQRKDSKKQVEDISWPESISVSLLFIAALLAVSCLWFSTREY